jgi:hypothetical protein
MPIRASHPPDSNVKELQQGMERMHRRLLLWRHPRLDAPDGVPHTTHNVRLDDAAAGAGLSRAGVVGWRYLLGTAERPAPTAAAEVHGAPGEETFAGVNAGPFVAESVAAIDRAHQDGGLAGDYEPRLLRVPALYVVALWLHELGGGEDAVIPLPSSHPGLESRPYRGAEFSEALRRVAAESPGESALAPQ